MGRFHKKTVSILLISVVLWSYILSVSQQNCNAQPDDWTDAIRLTYNSADSWDPAIAVYENNIHIVYSDNEGGAGSNTYLWYRNSTDGGKTWSERVRLTNNPTMSWYPAIAVNESNIHVIWFEEKDYTIHYINSTDNGKSWNGGGSISSLADSGTPPDVATSGYNIHVIYSNHSGGNDEILYENSSDNGIKWNDIQLLNVSVSAQDLRIAVNGNNVHIIWNDVSEIKYINSSDNGKTWKNIRTIETNSGVGDIAINGSTLHVIYRKLFAGISQIYYMNSEDNGDTWSTGKRLTGSIVHIYDGTIAVENEKVNVIWTDERDGNKEIYYMNSFDKGGNWSSEIRLTFDTSHSLYSDIATSEDAVYIVWTDTRDGNYEIYYKHYPVPLPPTNLTIDKRFIDDLILNWEHPQNSPSPVDHYHIYRSTTWDGFDFSTPWVNTSIQPDPLGGINPLRTSWNLTGALLDKSKSHFYIVRAIDAEGWNDTNTNIVGKYVIPMKEGWNMISLPLSQRNTSVSKVLQTIDGVYNVIWVYDAKEDMWCSSTTDLTDINRTMGLWIHMKNSCNLSIIGAVPESTDIELYEGWNLVGYPSLTNRNPNGALSGINWQAVQQYDAFDLNDHWKHNSTNKPDHLNDLMEMQPGRGYWICITINDTWTTTRMTEDNKAVVWRVHGLEREVGNQGNYEEITHNPIDTGEDNYNQIDVVPEEPTNKNEDDRAYFSFIPLIILIAFVFTEIIIFRKRCK